MSTNYKKKKAKKSFNKFIIVVEGELEKQYFSYFKNLSVRIDVQFVKSKNSKSSAKSLIDRLEEYNYRRGIEDEDCVWFVLDVYRWSMDQVEELNETCLRFDNWHIVLSNLSFEVWLLYHFMGDIPTEYNTIRKLKKALIFSLSNGCDIYELPSRIRVAENNAYLADPYTDDFYPSAGVSKIYNLASHLLSFLELVINDPKRVKLN